MRTPVTVLIVALACPLHAGDHAQRPELRLRITPRVAMSPVEVMITAELVGGGDIEDYYCPGVEWDFGDGNRRVRESDCAPWQEGAELQRRFTTRHVYRTGGNHVVRLTLFRADRAIAVRAVNVMVRSRFGNP